MSGEQYDVEIWSDVVAEFERGGISKKELLELYETAA